MYKHTPRARVGKMTNWDYRVRGLWTSAVLALDGFGTRKSFWYRNIFSARRATHRHWHGAYTTERMRCRWVPRQRLDQIFKNCFSRPRRWGELCLSRAARSTDNGKLGRTGYYDVRRCLLGNGLRELELFRWNYSLLGCFL